MRSLRFFDHSDELPTSWFEGIDPRIAYQFELDGRENSLPQKGFRHPDTFTPEQQQVAESNTSQLVAACSDGQNRPKVDQSYAMARLYLSSGQITQDQYLQIAEVARKTVLGDDYRPLEYPDSAFYARNRSFRFRNHQTRED